MRKCIKCDKTKNVSEFGGYVLKSGRIHRSNVCKKCVAERRIELRLLKHPKIRDHEERFIVCKKCGKTKSEDLFYRGGLKNLDYIWCKDCFRDWEKDKSVLEYYPNWHCGCRCDGQLKISSSHKENGIPSHLQHHYSQTAEFKEVFHDKMSGEGNPMFGVPSPMTGKHHTPETIELLRKLKIGTHHTDEAKQKNREKHLGKKATPATVEKFRKRMTGEGNHQFGKKGMESTNWNGGLVDRICPVDGTHFQTNPGKIAKGGGIFCSRKCSGIAERGSGHWNWKDGRSKFGQSIRNCDKYKIWRFEVFKRDSFICQKCGRTEKRQFIEAHHIEQFYRILLDKNIKTLEQALACEELWDIGNGITLCDECHEKEHKRMRLEAKREATIKSERHDLLNVGNVVLETSANRNPIS